MPKIKYHCKICDKPHDTEEEARKCESQGAKPFLFEIGDVLKPRERHGFQSTYHPTFPKETRFTIKERKRSPGDHENLYIVGPPTGKSKDLLGESFLNSEFEKINA